MENNTFYPKNDYRLYLEHSLKGAIVKGHKWIEREWNKAAGKWQYVYEKPKSLLEGFKKRQADKKNAESTNKMVNQVLSARKGYDNSVKTYGNSVEKANVTTFDNAPIKTWENSVKEATVEPITITRGAYESLGGEDARKKQIKYKKLERSNESSLNDHLKSNRTDAKSQFDESAKSLMEQMKKSEEAALADLIRRNDTTGQFKTTINKLAEQYDQESEDEASAIANKRTELGFKDKHADVSKNFNTSSEQIITKDEMSEVLNFMDKRINSIIKDSASDEAIEKRIKDDLKSAMAIVTGGKELSDVDIDRILTAAYGYRGLNHNNRLKGTSLVSPLR